MRLERTQDAVLIRQIIGHPEVRRTSYDAEGEIPVPFAERIYHLVARVEIHGDGAVHDDVVGIATFVPMNNVAWNPHLAILPAHRGAGTEVLAAAIEWMKANTACRKLVAHPPVFNAAMVRVFEKCGFSLEGKSPKSLGWHGELIDRLLMGREI